LAQAVGSLKRKVKTRNGTTALLDQCADAFARGDTAQGVAALAQIINDLPPAEPAQPGAAILARCVAQFQRDGPARLEYILLALHTLYVG
jgi:hypothetical protein